MSFTAQHQFETLGLLTIKNYVNGECDSNAIVGRASVIQPLTIAADERCDTESQIISRIALCNCGQSCKVIICRWQYTTKARFSRPVLAPKALEQSIPATWWSRKTAANGIRRFWSSCNSNTGRGVRWLSRGQC